MNESKQKKKKNQTMTRLTSAEVLDWLTTFSPSPNSSANRVLDLADGSMMLLAVARASGEAVVPRPVKVINKLREKIKR